MYEKCGECKYHQFRDGDWTCTNEDSEFYGEYTDYNDECEEFEER